ncbi:hypothetical protein CLM62_07105 [Streptomyces sp. SA15]|uniref:hypothetical protein n=1 Tax=Streptomyces sp. SA15 TaxID=934019 RepID=UPI000BB00B43|nr:hypothetical protein [Streptomyces sp. SA15]PAZ16692.1 hypothetical protein CLM62_07105 [Streptomyces sp. SA15]
MSTDTRPPLAHRLRGLNRPMVAALTAIALVRPLFSITGLSDALGKPLTPVLLTVVITLTWILAVGLTRVPEPLLTPVAAGVAYALAALVGSAVLSPVLTGELQGPLAQPYAIVPLFLVNAAWGAFCGICAIGVRRMRGIPG